jgi:serine/threonine protein kinase
MNLPIDVNIAPYNPLTDNEITQQHIIRENKLLRKDVGHSRRQWWQRSVVRRCFMSIESEFNNLIASSPFLQNHVAVEMHTKCIAIFHRSEIVTGELIGRGGFSQVMDIIAFNLLSEISDQCTPEQQSLREHYARTVLREDGISRYCIKHLQEKLIRKQDDFKLAACDLAIEAATLCALNEHDNIVSVRGLPIHGLNAWKYGQHDGYFIIMDRLTTTLDKRLLEWKAQKVTIQEKAQCALQLASALQYLHANRLLYRDLKPQNIGFSSNNEVKLFDFGLCRELPIGESTEDVYEMSGVGTRRYMAPEIVAVGKYNQKADVYGWSMVFWEILSLTKPYALYSTDDHSLHVCQNGERPNLQLNWPYWIRSLLKFSWDESLDFRFSIAEVYEHLSAALSAESEQRNSELYVTNHQRIVSNDMSVPTSPTGVHDFSINEPKSNNTTCKSIDDSIKRYHDSIDSMDRIPDFIDTISPPPPPKRPPTTFVNVPIEVVRTFELSLSDDDEKSNVTEVCRI